MRYFLGADIGGTKTHSLIADETGRVLGFGEAGSGNQQDVGYSGMLHALQSSLHQALNGANLSQEQICGAGFGVAGYDWHSQTAKMQSTIRSLGLQAPFSLVNDAILGLVAGAEEGWGVAVVSGTGCNCRGWDRQHRHEGRVTGYGLMMGEAAGSSELIYRAMQLVSFAWTRRGPATALSDALVEAVGATGLENLLEGYTQNRYHIGAELAPLVFQVAGQGDAVARDLIHWAGCELGEMANSVIRQLSFEQLAFDVVLAGSMFEGGAMLIDPMRLTIQKLAPQARLVRLRAAPVIGALLLGMGEGGVQPTPAIRLNAIQTLQAAGFS